MGENFQLTYDARTGVIHCVYGDIATPHIITALYEEAMHLTRSAGVTQVTGYIFDFRAVTRFAPGNMAAMQQNIIRVNRLPDIAPIPTALLVHNHVQEHLLRVAVVASPGKERRQIVHTLDEAHRFIQTWHADCQ